MCEFGPSRTMWAPEIAKKWPSGPSPASGIDFRTNFTKATLIPNVIWMFGVQSGPPRTTWGPEIARSWQTGPTPASDINIITNFTKATLIPNVIWMFRVQSGAPRTTWGRKWPKIGHLDHLQPQTSIFVRISLKQHWFQYNMDAWSSIWTISHHVRAGNGPKLAIWTISSIRYW